ncbi:MAG: AP2 domain-containing protein [Rhizobacter sp.]
MKHLHEHFDSNGRAGIPPKPERLLPPGLRAWNYFSRSAGGDLVAQRRWVVEHSQGGQIVKRKTFWVKRHGEERAKELALEQHALWQLAPPEPATKNRHRYLTGPGGQVGVYRLPEQGGQHPSWVARLYKPNGRRVRKQFSVNRRGEETARQMATDRQTRWRQG